MAAFLGESLIHAFVSSSASTFFAAYVPVRGCNSNDHSNLSFTIVLCSSCLYCVSDIVDGSYSRFVVWIGTWSTVFVLCQTCD